MKFTVITVCFNASETIETTIKSVLNQDYESLEYIIIDGNSDDQTLGIIKKYSDNSQHTVKHRITKWVSEPDEGIYDAMNKGLKHASGDYLIFMGADDVFINDSTLSNVAIWIDKFNDDIIYGAVQMKSTGSIDRKQFGNLRFSIGNICHQCIFYPRSVYKKSQYDLKYRVYADYAYNLKVRKYHNFRQMPVVVSVFNDTGISSLQTDVQFDKDRRKLLISSVGWGNYVMGCFIRYIANIRHRLYKR